MKTVIDSLPLPRALASFSLMLLLLTGCNENTGNQAVSEEPDRDLNEVPDALQDAGTKGEPFVLDIESASVDNDNYREVRWTGEFMQMVLMSVGPGEEIDLEIHNDLDQFIRIEEGQARILMGETEDDLSFQRDVEADWALLIPAGYYHNVKNIGNTDLKLYTIYAPAAHPEETVHRSYEEAREYEEEHEH